MCVDVASPQSLLEASYSRNSSPVTTNLGAKEDYTSLHMSSAEAPYSETAQSPLPSSVDLLLQDSPDSSTSPKAQLPASVEKDPARKERESKGQGRKQKVRTVFSQMQLCILKDRFQKQKYPSLQQMQELSEVLNLSYEQRMKCKRWPKNNHGVTQVSAPTEYLDVYDSYHQGCLPSGNLPMWSNQSWNRQACNNQSWNKQGWNSQAWSNQTWNSSQMWNSQLWCTPAWSNQAWDSPAWTNPFQNCEEDFPLPQVQQASLCDLEAIHTLDFFLNESISTQSEDCMKTDI
ncbi:homeobox protein NANOG-like [Tenrec ecaudatus]|uniref:homeobox protein NANOG-like n=1 Tax=Tenrec ecaudatus TaxID=94439 RepID=UPI003F5A31B9